MARGWFNQRWWWLLVATFTGMSFLAAADWISYPSGKDSPGYVSGNKVLVYLREQCERDINLSEIRDFLSHYESRFTVEVIPKTVTCESRSRGLGGLVQALGQTSTRALIAALDVNTCDVAARLAHLWDKPLLTWTCPLKSVEERELSSIVRLSPSLPAMAEALTQIFLHFKWKSVAVIGTDHEPWSSLDRAVVGALRSIGVLPRHHMVLPSRATVKQIHTSLRPLHTIPCRVLVLCLPLDAEFSSRVLAELDVMRESHYFFLLNSARVLLFLKER
ncbi:uncharacterized protein LOC107270796 [Cephus cinctus]|uniref:Uncharacterized protein LOC107270796 n=1 Tax=Cephus cinctus TaxID=211228 RepID=A0AAJ7RMV5_CEPCN|nr:uncharacterized protein LOC107270796 [Cephus cinctus]